jgi:hypothetical protein
MDRPNHQRLASGSGGASIVQEKVFVRLNTKDQQQVFHAPLHPLDSEKQTQGCRHTSPNACAKHSLLNVCAFVRKDNICLPPPTTWKKKFQKLFVQQFGKPIQKQK